MIDVSGLKLSLDAGLEENRDLALKEVARQLGIAPAAITSAQLLKRSVDARKKSNVHFIATYRLELAPEDEARLLEQVAAKHRKLKGLQINLAKPYEPLAILQLEAPAIPPVVVGLGPAGLFAAWYLAKCGLCPLVIEQGAPVDERARDVAHFFETGELNPWSNIQFGEGGAGTFSDGKLTTNLKNRYTPHVLRWFVEAGAPESILWQAHPHLGSDNLAHIVAAIRGEIIRLGGVVRFHTQLTDLAFVDGALEAITVKDLRTDAVDVLPCQTLILACGHSARSVFELTRDAGLVMEQKPFSMGVRIEHPQALINEAQWGSACSHPALEAAEYKLAIHLPSGRTVYSFCMCPGGEVVAAASEEGGIVTNGMSNYARDGKNANAALLVNVNPSDFGSDDVLAGVALQQEVEQRAFKVAQQAGGMPYQAPSQRVGEFLATGSAKSAAEAGDVCEPTYECGVVNAPIDNVLPPFVSNALREALPLMGKKIAGFDNPSAILTAPETRSSSPVRICRDETLQAYFPISEMGHLGSDPLCPTSGSAQTESGQFGTRSEVDSSEAGQHGAGGEVVPGSGLYPCGEGPGFAGGIMSAAVDGLKVAQAVAARYQEAEAEAENECDSFTQVVDALRRGEAALFPTDTVYGLGVAVEAAESPAVLYQLKQRSDDKPIAWLIGSARDLETYGKHVPVWAKELAEKHWPGALTLIVEASDAVPAAYRSTTGTIALRMPNHPDVLNLIKEVGPLATTSANLSGTPAPATLAEVPAAFTSALPALPGETQDGIASTVVDCTTPEPTIIRQGTITL